MSGASPSSLPTQLTSRRFSPFSNHPPFISPHSHFPLIITVSSADIFVGFLGFKYQADDSLDPPDVSEDTEESREARRRLLQCWLEVGLWIENHKLLNGELDSLPWVRSDGR